MKDQIYTPTPGVYVLADRQKLTERERVFRGNVHSAGASVRRYSSTTVCPHKNILNALGDPKQRTMTPVKPTPLPNPSAQQIFSPARQYSARCQSSKLIHLIQSTEFKRFQQKKEELRKRDRESLKEWKIIRGLRKRKERDERKEIEKELKQRRRQSQMENLLKDRAKREEKELRHEMNQEWIATIRKSRKTSHSHLSKSNKSIGKIRKLLDVPTIFNYEKSSKYSYSQRLRPYSSHQPPPSSPLPPPHNHPTLLLS